MSKGQVYADALDLARQEGRWHDVLAAVGRLSNSQQYKICPELTGRNCDDSRVSPLSAQNGTRLNLA